MARDIDSCVLLHWLAWFLVFIPSLDPIIFWPYAGRNPGLQKAAPDVTLRLMEVKANIFTFDTHDFVKRLIGAGMPEAQAEILAREQ